MTSSLLSVLPREVLLFNLLPMVGADDARDLMHFMATCHSAWGFSRDPLLWKQMYRLWMSDGYEQELGGPPDVFMTTETVMDDRSLWHERARFAYESRFVRLNEVSRYNDDYYCEIRGVVFTRASLSVLFHVHGDNSLGPLQEPHHSRLFRTGPPTVSEAGAADGNQAHDRAVEEEEEDEPLDWNTMVVDGVTPPPGDGFDEDDDEAAEQGDGDVAPGTATAFAVNSELQAVTIAANNQPAQLEALFFPRNPVVVSNDVVLPTSTVLEINQHHAQIRGSILYRSSCLARNASFRFSYGHSGYAHVHLFALTPQFIQRHRLGHIVRSIASSRRLSHLLDHADVVHAQRQIVLRRLRQQSNSV